MKEIKYEFAKIKKISLDDLYQGSTKAYQKLDELLIDIVNKEAPITMNILKLRLRTSFGVDRIREKAQTIIDNEIKKLGFTITDNLYDIVLWPKEGTFNVDYLRVGIERTIYDVPYQEMVNLAASLNKKGEELYREILKYFGFEVLTKKALDYLKFIEEKI